MRDKPGRLVIGSPVPHAGESNGDFRARVEQHHAALAEERRVQLDAQASASNSPAERIRIWEDLHQLRMPLDATHRLLNVIAVGTRLTLADVQDEQARRAAKAHPSASAGAAHSG